MSFNTNRSYEQFALFESIINFSNDAIITKTLDGIITSWNKAAGILFQYAPDEIIGKHISMIIPKELISEELAIIEKIRAGQNVQHYETVRLRKDGSSVCISLTISPLKNDDGVIVGASKIARDITADIAGKKALEERNLILESIDDAFFAVDKNWVVTYWNNKAEKVLGKTKHQMLNHNLWEVFSDAVNLDSYKKYHEAVETNRVTQFEDYYPPLHKWYEISAYPSDNGLSVYFKDVTERKNIEIHLQELNEHLSKQARELAMSNAELEQFAYVASHDLQEPLRMVTSFLTQLEKKYGDIIDEKGKKYIYFAVDGAKRMRQIILDLLEFSRVGRTNDSLEDVDIVRLVNDILTLFRKQIEDTKAAVTLTNLPTIHIYRSPIRQIFQNLISNSLKYQKQGVIPVISIGCEEGAQHWQFSVKDNGIGIDAEYFDKIFIIFQRLHHKDEYSGTGMGLAITKKIIENLGGKIWLTSDEGHGSTFYFTIPKNIKL